MSALCRSAHRKDGEDVCTIRAEDRAWERPPAGRHRNCKLRTIRNIPHAAVSSYADRSPQASSSQEILEGEPNPVVLKPEHQSPGGHVPGAGLGRVLGQYLDIAEMAFERLANPDR